MVRIKTLVAKVVGVIGAVVGGLAVGKVSVAQSTHSSENSWISLK